MTRSARTTVTIPTYNERETIVSLLEAVHEHLPAADILVVDDSSPDGTAELVEGFMADHGYVKLRVRPVREGLGPAYADAFERLIADGCERICHMDADFSHDPERLPDFMAVMDEGAELVIGSRYVPGGGTENWPLSRRIMSRCGSWYAATVLGLPVRDATGGFKCWDSALLAKVLAKELCIKGFGFMIETTFRAHLLGAKIVEVPIVFRDRRQGQSKMSGRIFREALLGVLKLRLRGRALV